MFTSVPRPITLDDDVPISTTVINLIATDSDGTAPGNQVYIRDPSTGISILELRLLLSVLFIGEIRNRRSWNSEQVFRD